MNWRRDHYSRDAHEWGEFFGTWILLIVAWVAKFYKRLQNART